MQLIKILVVPLAIGLGSIEAFAADPADSDVPVTKHQAEAVKNVPKDAVTKDQTAPAREIPATPHQAQTVKEVPLKFGDLDSDGNGTIDREEAKKFRPLKQQWSKLDQNADGQLEEAEFLRFEQDGETDRP